MASNVAQTYPWRVTASTGTTGHSTVFQKAAGRTLEGEPFGYLQCSTYITLSAPSPERVTEIRGVSGRTPWLLELGTDSPLQGPIYALCPFRLSANLRGLASPQAVAWKTGSSITKVAPQKATIVKK